jgi:glycosyltransferase involved in cell wall biosynthesis
MIDAALADAGWRSLVVAAEDSRVAGELISVPRARGRLTPKVIEAARNYHRVAIARTLRQRAVDVVHLHGLDFEHYWPSPDVPTLVTLHCPSSWYPPRSLQADRANTVFNAVSRHQSATLPTGCRLLPPIENGVPIAALSARHAKRSFALMLGRIAPDKGVHVGLQAAHDANVPLIVAGQVFSYPEHEAYFASMVAPRLDRRRRFIGPIGLARKRRLLGAARCLLVCSQADETSSLVAREALAAGTPVVALRRGALASTIEHERTGFLVENPAALAAAIKRTAEIDPDTCRRVAHERFDARRMTQSYMGVYRALAQRQLLARRRATARAT